MKVKLNKFIIGLIAVFIFFTFFILIKKMEGEKPDVEFTVSDGIREVIGSETEIAGSVSDAKSGIRDLSVSLIKDEAEIILFEKSFPKDKRVYTYDFNISIEPKALKIKDGNALFKVSVSDYSWRNSGSGNQVYMEKRIVIDTKPPRMEILSHAHNIKQGGAGLVIYRISESCEKSGVKVGDNFFPGYSGHFDDENIFLCFIGLGYDQPTDTPMYAEASDYAGNTARAGFYNYLRKGYFKKDTIDITDNFLNKKIPEFWANIDLKRENVSLIEQFLEVNRDVRRSDFERIKEVCEKTASVILWEENFVRFPQSSTRAGFAEKRTYKYKGKDIDEQVHLGIDLASTAYSVIPAANSGRIVFAEFLGIYGNSVIIDHGLGLFSLYAHLSRVDVEAGVDIIKGEPIGLTGMTGMAGGDHLHFSMIVHNIFVNPIEWFDSNWIKNNITSKIEAVIDEEE